MAVQANTTSRRNFLASTAGAVLVTAATALPSTAASTDAEIAELEAAFPRLEASAERVRQAAVTVRQADATMAEWFKANPFEDTTSYVDRRIEAMKAARLGATQLASNAAQDAHDQLCFEIAELSANSLEALIVKARLACHDSQHDIIGNSIVADLLLIGDQQPN